MYPSLHPLISWGNDHQVQSRESYRAAAKNHLALGAHGISAYNYQYHWRPDKGKEDDWPRVMDYLTGVRELGDTERGDRRYLFHPMWSGHGGGIGPSGAHRDIRIILGPQEKRRSGSLELRLAENLKNSEASATLEFKVTGLAAGDGLTVTFNDESLSDRPFERCRDEDGQSAGEGRVLPAFDRFRFPLRASDIKFGDNRLAVALHENPGTDDVVVQELEVFVQATTR